MFKEEKGVFLGSNEMSLVSNVLLMVNHSSLTRDESLSQLMNFEVSTCMLRTHMVFKHSFITLCPVIQCFIV